MSYEDFETAMIEAGWSPEEVYKQWLVFEMPEDSGDHWDTEGWDRD